MNQPEFKIESVVAGIVFDKYFKGTDRQQIDGFIDELGNFCNSAAGLPPFARFLKYPGHWENRYVRKCGTVIRRINNAIFACIIPRPEL